MPAIKITKFLGSAPKVAEELLPDTAAQYAANCKFYSGNLHPYPRPMSAASLTRSGVIQTIYPMDDGAGGKVWLHWTTDVDVAESQLAEDATQRIYYTGDGAPKQTNYSLATTGVGDYPIASRPLGVPAPTVAATATAASSAAIATTHRARSGNIATLTLASAPQFGVGTTITITTVGGTGYNLSNVSVTAVAGNNVSYNCPGSDEATTADAAGSVAFGGVPLLRNYVYTWVTDWEEESPPSPATSDVSAYSGQKVTVSSLPTTAPVGYSGIVTKKNVYRTVTGAAGTFYFLVERDVPLATASIDDTDSDAALVDILPSLDYDMPNSGMKGITNMPNGMLVGFFGNQLCFSEPYKPWAWPIKYRRTINAPIVGLGVVSTSVFVLTERNPQIAQGTSPSVVAVSRVDVNYPCVSKRSIVNMGMGVMYASPDGLVTLTPMGNELATKLIHYRDTWVNEIVPSTLVGRYYNGKYFASSSTKSFVFEREESTGGLYSELSFTYTAGYYDFDDGYLYYVDSINPQEVKRWDDPEAAAGTLEWWSKRFRFPAYLNMGAARVFADYDSADLGITAENAVREAFNLSLTETLGALAEHAVADYAIAESELLDPLDGGATVTFQLYANERLVFTRTLASDRMFRLPHGYKVDNISVRISSNVRIREIHLAETPSGLTQL